MKEDGQKLSEFGPCLLHSRQGYASSESYDERLPANNLTAYLGKIQRFQTTYNFDSAFHQNKCSTELLLD